MEVEELVTVVPLVTAGQVQSHGVLEVPKGMCRHNVMFPVGMVDIGVVVAVVLDRTITTQTLVEMVVVGL